MSKERMTKVYICFVNPDSAKHEKEIEEALDDLGVYWQKNLPTSGTMTMFRDAAAVEMKSALKEKYERLYQKKE